MCQCLYFVKLQTTNKNYCSKQNKAYIKKNTKGMKIVTYILETWLTAKILTPFPFTQ